MKTPITLLLTCLLIFTAKFSFTQVSDSIYFERLYRVCKVWGHVKYYHTEVANGSVNWDVKLLEAVNGFKQAPTESAFNDSLLLLINQAGAMSTPGTIIPPIPDSLNNNHDLSWIHNSQFSNAVVARLDTIFARFEAQSHVLVGEAWAGGTPIFDSDNQFFNSPVALSDELRILALCRYWNIIHYFYPYKKIMDQHWDETLKEFIPKIVNAPTILDYQLAFKELTTRINDSHAFFYAPNYDHWEGRFPPPFLVRYIENQMVITKVVDTISEVKVGDVITKLDGIDVTVLRDSLRKYVEGSNEPTIDRNLNTMLIQGDSGPFSITVDDGQTVQTTTLERKTNYATELREDLSPTWSVTTLSSGCLVGVVNMGKLENSDVPDMWADLYYTDMIVFDVRNYPNNTFHSLASVLLNQITTFSRTTIGNIYFPGRMFWSSNDIYPNYQTEYAGGIALLFDERTQSHAEWTCMALEVFPNTVKIGSTTAGADGNVSTIYLPGYMRAMASFIGVYYPEYSPTQRVGITPHYEVHPTIAGIRAGKDEVLDFALNCGLVNSVKQVASSSIALYPNPANHTLHFKLTANTKGHIDILDLQGRIIATQNVNGIQGTIPINELASGTYIVRINTKHNVISQIFIKE